MAMPQKKTSLKDIPRLHRKTGLYLADAGVKGRGVFCTTAIAAGEVLEVTPALILNQNATKQADKTILCDYTFTIGALSKGQRTRARLKNAGDASTVVMGILSFCNHDTHPNAEVLWEEAEGTVYYSLRATRRIPKGAEICTTYGKTWFADRE